MPELPEVETVVRGLAKKIKGARLTKITLRREGLRYPFPQELATYAGTTVQEVVRRGKFVLLNLASQQTILLHLGMSGRVFFPEAGIPIQKHDHVSFYFENSAKSHLELRFNDPRRFGVVDVHPTETLIENRHLKNLGFEPFDKAFTPHTLYTLLKNRRVPIKQAIMNANLLVGVGNIYASESLFQAGICPTKPAGKLTKVEAKKLHAAIIDVLTKAIAAGGTSLRDYVQTDGTLGYFQHQFRVYGQGGKPCKVCKTPIEKLVQAGRATYFCSQCQK